ncbi:LipB [Laribacter hongkongensis HLHK9]|uniref:Octanoyltransferase n=1 Tax=Laribacter hongkongensis (strain HLHK9) TaxID=557598 RepID=LIPB_LARHH|nr:lipoyl(octanoyl) transferase LipB [Laribacter hongkongensis]C1D5T4.1 RecName: Full=Octanoyltransferase; AltName: Full=Lipoate-protein ligase B; AltName: Full=Lipoyl/octanoyl transferase; AltName: Full=Octanoyl-[acyl-carrier-protein]-protein N-octanoyltransferase [Laribacter hongkongensis HLHK9]ACO73965.1 LipB [Laribacter hongkongensis HLHK9]MCG9053525.1 lipoyl(octanoyl) transferase LipB [Laribacter hongkongensis]MCG9078888.1 lipoyl(octanoyl) transferase LipB [Laribacter hongkongensis]
MHIRHLGLVDYEPTWHAMQAFTETRTGETPDELWIVEHPPVYTLGLAGKPEHLLQQTAIPLVKTDRGGQITYHGPGQLVVYLLMDLRRRDYGVRDMVRRIEQAIIDTLADYGIEARGDVNAPGVYVGARKIASLGLRIKNHATYHGLSLNVSMDLAPFGWINPCGYAGLEVTRMTDLGVEATLAQVAERLIPHLETRLARPQHETEA